MPGFRDARTTSAAPVRGSVAEKSTGEPLHGSRPCAGPFLLPLPWRPICKGNHSPSQGHVLRSYLLYYQEVQRPRTSFLRAAGWLAAPSDRPHGVLECPMRSGGRPVSCRKKQITSCHIDAASCCVLDTLLSTAVAQQHHKNTPLHPREGAITNACSRHAVSPSHNAIGVGDKSARSLNSGSAGLACNKVAPG